jgi:Ca2+-binding EF-hand superfamily protein
MISAEESALSAEMFSTVDADQDGLVTEDEIETMMASSPPPMMGSLAGPGPGGGPMDAQSIVEAEDGDGDGMISAGESALSAEMFSSKDADQDGYLTVEEIEEDMSVRQEETASGQDYSRTLAVNAYQQALQAYMNGSAGWLGVDGSELGSLLGTVA